MLENSVLDEPFLNAETQNAETRRQEEKQETSAVSCPSCVKRFYFGFCFDLSYAPRPGL
jgi:hypothetical protein